DRGVRALDIAELADRAAAVPGEQAAGENLRRQVRMTRSDLPQGCGEPVRPAAIGIENVDELHWNLGRGEASRLARAIRLTEQNLTSQIFRCAYMTWITLMAAAAARRRRRAAGLPRQGRRGRVSRAVWLRIRRSSRKRSRSAAGSGPRKCRLMFSACTRD